MEYKAIIIGSGPAGYVAAIRLGQLGNSSIVIDERYIGGTCLNVGCIPTKALLKVAYSIEYFEKTKKEVGFELEKIKVDLHKVNEWKTQIINRLTKGIENLWKGNKVDFIKGHAIIKDKNRVEVKREDGFIREIKGEYIVVATGSKPIPLKGINFDGEYIWSSEDALALKKIPSSLLIIGGGVIGVEFAYIYRMLGSEVTIFELMPQILPGMDSEMVIELSKILQRKGIKIYTNTRAKDISVEKGKVKLVIESSGKTESFEGDNLLIAIGRKPNTDGLNLEGLGIILDKNGYIKVDSQYRTNIPNIFAIGDVVGPPLLAHKASKEGVIVAETIAGKKTTNFNIKALPTVVFSYPEFASVGITEQEAKAMEIDIEVSKFPLSANGKALISGEYSGLVKIISSKGDKKILGVHIISPEASSLIGEGVIAIELGLTAKQLGSSIHPHPTLGEAVMEAAQNLYGEAIHILSKRKN